MMKIIYEDIPEKELFALKSLIPKIEWLIPKWLHVLTVYFNPNRDPDDSIASISPNEKYRYASLYINKLFFDIEDESERQQHLLHEILHIHLQPLHALIVDQVAACWDEPGPICKLIEKQFKNRIESICQDVSVAIQEKDGTT